MERPFNQSIYQSIHPSINQSLKQVFNQSGYILRDTSESTMAK